jgi:hypothetical protein
MLFSPMAEDDQERLQELWEHYRSSINDYDDLTLARWISQTLGQLKGRVWRLSHPLVGLHRLLATTAHKRALRTSRLAQVPSDYPLCNSCGAPLLPLVTRDVAEDGLVCETCGTSAIPLADLPAELRGPLQDWAARYAPVHEVAHWTDAQRARSRDYDKAYQEAAEEAETLLLELSGQILPVALDHFPAIVWEDHDECLDVRPDDVIP